MLIDTHAHLDEDAFTGDFEPTLARARAAGVHGVLTIGTTLASSQSAISLAERRPDIWAAVGIHPNYAAAAHPDDWEQVAALAGHPRVRGIGETGLDRYWDHSPIDVQVDFFRRHLALADEIGKPFIVHCRDADAEVLAELQREHERRGGRPLSGVMHAFCGSADMARECLALGLHLSFAGMLTFKRNAPLRETAALAPLDRILVETDSPYLAPAPHRGKRNEPAHARLTAQCLAEARTMPLQELATATTENARRLFGFEPPQ